MSFLGFLKAKNHRRSSSGQEVCLVVQHDQWMIFLTIIVLFSVQNHTRSSSQRSGHQRLLLTWNWNHLDAFSDWKIVCSTGFNARLHWPTKAQTWMMFQSDTRCNCSIYELGFKIVENCRMFKVSELDNLLNGWIGALRQACPVCASHNAWWSRSS